MINKAWSIVKTFLSFLWFPLLLLGIFLVLAYKITGYQDPETVKVVLGVMLGVALGFIADILKRSLDQYNERKGLKNTALSLLKNDAEKIYRSMEMMKRARENKDTTPKELREAIEKSLPPLLELRYWKRLNQENNFLLLGSTEPFKSIFSDLWEMEKINQLITLAKNGDNQSYMFAMTIYQTALEDKHHEKLLKKFMSASEIKIFKETWNKMS